MIRLKETSQMIIMEKVKSIFKLIQDQKEDHKILLQVEAALID